MPQLTQWMPKKRTRNPKISEKYLCQSYRFWIEVWVWSWLFSSFLMEVKHFDILIFNILIYNNNNNNNCNSGSYKISTKVEILCWVRVWKKQFVYLKIHLPTLSYTPSPDKILAEYQGCQILAYCRCWQYFSHTTGIINSQGYCQVGEDLLS